MDYDTSKAPEEIKPEKKDEAPLPTYLAPPQNFTQLPKKKKSKLKVDKVAIYILAGLFVVIAIVAVIVFWPKGKSNDVADKPAPEPEEVVEEESEEEVNAKLVQNVNRILSLGASNSKDKSTSFTTPNSDLNYYTKLSDNGRFYIATHLVDVSNSKASKLGESDVKKIGDYACQRIFSSACANVTSDVYTTWYKVDAQKVKDRYQELFGVLPGSIPDENLVGCPSYYYVAKLESFIGTKACTSPSNAPTVTIYQDKISYSLDDTKAYAYFYAGIIKQNAGTYELYNDLEGGELIKVLQSNKFELTSSNAKNFAQYRMVFNKKDGKYVYRNVIEKIEEEDEDDDDKKDTSKKTDDKEDNKKSNDEEE